MNNTSRNNQILVLTTHQYVLNQFLRIFRRQELRDKKPPFGWTAALELEIDRESLEQYMLAQSGYDQLNRVGIEQRNDLFHAVHVADFKVISE